MLDGTGRSTQIGDSGAFFIGAGGLLALGAIRNHAALVISGGLLVGLVIPGRVLSATTHDGAWTPDEIAGECIVLVVALLTAAAIPDKTHNLSFGKPRPLLYVVTKTQGTAWA